MTGACNLTGIWPDATGCCPAEINGQPFYRDANGCYPILTSVGVAYADVNGCYPDAQGIYLGGNQECPALRKCVEECLSE